MPHKLNPLMIGDLEVKIPIIQGGMGVKVSMAPLAAAVANAGAAGTIASVGLAYGIDETGRSLVEASDEALGKEVRQAKKLTKGPVGINIMVALSNYESLVKIAVQEKADFIVSGAGIPLSLPELTKGSPIKLIPIVSSMRAAGLIVKTWKRRYDRLPDAIVVEGPLAGGHLGFRFEDLESGQADTLEGLVKDVVGLVPDVPVIAAGGIFTGADLAKFLRLGARGVQIATRFVATHECSVPDEFKKLYLEAREEDTILIKSPVGMPGRAIKTKFVERVMRGERIPFKCPYKCLRVCDPRTAPYCIARALCNAVLGDIDNSIVFAGKNVSRVNKIVSVKELIDEIVSEAEAALGDNK